MAENSSIEYTAGYLEGLGVNCFRDNPSDTAQAYFKATPDQEACRLEQRAAEDELRRENGMEMSQASTFLRLTLLLLYLDFIYSRNGCFVSIQLCLRNLKHKKLSDSYCQQAIRNS